MLNKTRVAFVSLGCAKNLVDSEKMLGQLAEAGCVLSNESDADVVVVNTCGFLESSRTEADEIIRELVDRKADGQLARVVVAGCLVQRDRRALLDRIEGIDAIVGVNNRDDVVRAVVTNGRARTNRTTDVFLSDYHPFTQLDTARLRLTPNHYAYLRISEGCDQKCTFCTIPSIRGLMHCKPPEVILNEARELVGDGAVELSLIGQDTTSYGLGDDPIEGGLAALIRKLDRVEGIGWVRLMYAYPTALTDEMLDAIAECEHVCNYIDLPLQHINDRMLKAMHRRVDRSATEALLERIQRRIPGVTLRTTMIVGFPGETEEEFDELVEFVRTVRFDALGVFPYSQEPDTPAGRMAHQISDQVKRDRVDALMQAQQEVAFARNREREGRTFDVLVDDVEADGTITARHEGQAPSVDSVTFVESCDVAPGEFIAVRCTGHRDYDLLARPSQVALPVVDA